MYVFCVCVSFVLDAHVCIHIFFMNNWTFLLFLVCHILVNCAQLFDALFVSVTTPISRLELSSLNGARLRQCADLRQVLFVRTRKVMLAIKSSTSELLNQYPSSVIAYRLTSCSYCSRLCTQVDSAVAVY